MEKNYHQKQNNSKKQLFKQLLLEGVTREEALKVLDEDQRASMGLYLFFIRRGGVYYSMSESEKAYSEEHIEMLEKEGRKFKVIVPASEKDNVA